MSKTKKIISVVLATALIMAMATVAMISASAATTVYFENSEGWSEVAAYVWGGAGGEELGIWPGSPCTLVEGNVWSVEIPDDCTNVIFNNNNNGAQTNNLVNPGASQIAKLGEGTELNEYGQPMTVYAWEDYADAPVVTTEATTAAPVETEATTAAPVETEATTAAPVVTEPAATEAPVVTEPTEAPATEDEPVVDPATDDEEPVVTEPTEAPVVTEPATDAPVVTEPATDAPVVTEPAGDDLGVKVGDVITYTATLETPKNIENIQATLKYSADTLKLVDATVAERFPNMSGVVSNAADGAIYFNASEISTGFDFVGGKTLITAQFEVIAEGNVYVETVIEEMVEFFGPDYVTGGEIVADGVALTDELILPDVTPTTTETAPVTTEATTATTEATTEATTAEKTTDVQSSTDAPDEEKDVVDTGVAAAIYVVLAVLSMAAAAVVVLRKKANG